MGPHTQETQPSNGNSAPLSCPTESRDLRSYRALGSSPQASHICHQEGVLSSIPPIFIASVMSLSCL